MKLKPLLPSLKEKRRYVSFEIISKNKIYFNEIKKTIISSYKNLFGDMGLAKANLKIIKEKENTGIIKTNHKYVDEVKASLSLIKKINNQKIIARGTGVSGIIKKLRTKHMEG